MKLPTLILSALVLGSLTASAQTATDRPNIVLFLMDDMGINDVGAYAYPSTSSPYPMTGPAPVDNSAYSPVAAPNSAWDAVSNVSRTPRIDSIAANGARLTSFYAASPVCSPSRAALMTGSYPLRVGLNSVYYPNANNGLSPNEITLPELLKLRGYSTCMVGKWHLGDHLDFIPTRHGFDRYLGLLYSNDMWVGNTGAAWPDLNLMDGEVPAGPTTTSTGGSIVNPITTSTEQSYLLEAMTEASLDFIQEKHAAGEPFLLYYSPHAPHTPCFPHPEFEGATGLGSYYDVVAELDHRVGQILDKLDNLGIANDTIVIFTSDNGPWITRYGSQTTPGGILKRELPENRVGSAYPFRGYKHETWEGGQRVPFLARFPGVIPAGIAINEVSALFDVYTTLAAWAGAELPSDGRVLDGGDMRPMLTGAGVSPHDVFVYYDSDNSTPEGIRDGYWKLRLGNLYDLLTDPQESTDVNNPSVESAMNSKRNAFDTSLKANIRTTATSKSVSIQLSTNTVHVPENGTAAVQVWLSGPANTTVTITAKMGDSDLSVVAGGSLSFTTGNYSTPQTVTLACAQDADSGNGGALFRATSSATNLREIFVLEQDSIAGAPGILVAESGGSTSVAEGGASDGYSVVLQSEPTGDVTLTLTPDLQLLASGTARPSVLTFSPANWSTPQMVSVEAVDDFAPEGGHVGTIAHSVTSADPNYEGRLVPDMNVAVTDNDTLAEAPAAPEIAGELVLWLRDAARLYSDGTWADSSLLGNDVSDLDAGGGYGGRSSLGSLGSGTGLFAGQSVPVVHISDNGLMGNLDLLDSAVGFTNLTIVAIYQTGGTSSETRPLGIGSKTYQGTAANRDRFNLAADSSLRYDDGNNLGTPGNHDTSLLLRASRLGNGTVTDWIDRGAGLVQNIGPTSTPSNGSIPNPTASDAFFLGELGTPVGVADSSSADCRIAQVAVYKAALTNLQIADVADWMIANPGGPVPTEAHIWRSFFFGDPANSGNGADAADFDGDGQSNLMERAFRTSPIHAADHFEPRVFVLQDGGGDYLHVTYRRVRGGSGTTGVDYTAGGMRYTVEVSNDLDAGSWQSGVAHVVAVGDPVPAEDGQTETVTVRLLEPTGSHPRRFIRLVVAAVP